LKSQFCKPSSTHKVIIVTIKSGKRKLDKIAEQAQTQFREDLAYNGISSTINSHHTSNPRYTKSWGDYVPGEIAPAAGSLSRQAR
jgi:hypothetical protein